MDQDKEVWHADGDYVVMYKEVVNDTAFSTQSRLLARQLMDNPLTTVGEYFRTLPDDDLLSIREMIEHDNLYEDGDESETARDIIIMALMLNQAEGGACGDLDDVVRKVQAFKLLASVTEISRAGFARPNFVNFSLQTDADHLVIAERIAPQDEDDDDDE